MKSWRKNCFLNALLYVKFLKNFLIKIVGDILKNYCYDTVAKRVRYPIPG